MKDIYSVLCNEFDNACQEKYGIHGMILYKNPDNKSNKWISYTYYDFAEYVIIRQWGIYKYSEMVNLFDELDYMDNCIKIVYSQKGYYPGKIYEE